MFRKNFGRFLGIIIGVIIILVATSTLSLAADARDWPTKTITIIVGSAAGGNSDLAARTVSSEMSKILRVPIVVVNMPGGGGGISAENVFRAPNDGYTWNAQGSAMRTYGVMGFHASAPQDWYCLPTTTYSGSIAVRMDSPYKTFADLIAALKKDPGKISYAASQPATAYRISMETIRVATGLSARFIPYMGTAPTHVALLTGDVQFIMTAVGEQAELLRGKKIRALAVHQDEPYDLKGYGKIPAITDSLPQMKQYLPYQGWSAISMRADIPKPILRKIDDAFLKAIQTKSVKEFCERFEVSLIGLAGEEAQKLYLKQASIDSWMLYEVGVAKKNPAELNIPKP
jgi:tripartite-type tricarboxylate transporter receptor subunit TctC